MFWKCSVPLEVLKTAPILLWTQRRVQIKPRCVWKGLQWSYQLVYLLQQSEREENNVLEGKRVVTCILQQETKEKIFIDICAE